MDFLVKIAETGVSYSYSKVPGTDKFSINFAYSNVFKES